MKIAVALFLAAAALGCGGSKSEKDTVDAWFDANPKLKREPVAQVAGHVSVDGQPPPKGARLFVILTDVDHIEPITKTGPKVFTHCDGEGNFKFTTYVTGDGVPYGKYVASFVLFHNASRRNGKGGFGVAAGREREFAAPDMLKNTYSDPMKNKSDPTLQVDVDGKGRSDYDFALTVAGKDEVIAPSQYVPTHVGD
ncbi:MAG TPA: hypothetical protein VFG04_00730 [Planctomycetaceae bacterium]|nr:hypothetical protein [Planctomycetaceae bacterium]